jgi:type II secretory pathway pseudopilin PulG
MGASMILPALRPSCRQTQRGETLIGLLIATAIGAIILAATASSFTGLMRSLWDRVTIAEANNQAREIARIISADFRMIGSGMPLGAPKFDMLDVTLGNAALPILTSSTTTDVRYRLNEYGRFTSTTASFDPATQTNLAVLSTQGFSPQQWVYISNVSSEFSQSSTVGGARGRITSTGGTTLSLSGIIAGAGVQFNPGSTVELVTDATLNCAAPAGITRDTGSGPVTLYPKSSCTVTYLDATNAALTPPLTQAAIQSSLTSMRVTVTVPGRRKLRSGAVYSAQVTETVALRNLILARNP